MTEKNKVMIHTHALVEVGAEIGGGTRIWAFSHILPGAKIGKDCNICDHTFIENDVVLGDRNTVKSGVYLWDGVISEADVFIGPCAVFTNDSKPRSRKYPDSYPKTYLNEGCSIGANATILPGVSVGRWALVGAGSVVTKDVEDHALVLGNPSRFKGWVCRCGERLFFKCDEDARCACGLVYRLNEGKVQAI